MVRDAGDIILAFRDIRLSKTQAAKLVGGRTRLETLVAQEKIRATKKNGRQNGKWYCNGSDVIMHIKQQI